MTLELPYTICFCYRDEHVLLLHRRRPPNQHRWNGLGGKIEIGETPRQNILREVMEEAGIDLTTSPFWRYAGIMTWCHLGDETAIRRGMYVYLAAMPADQAIWEDEQETDEGQLAWKPMAWIVDHQNPDIVSNVTYCLPHMLTATAPHSYQCGYDDASMTRIAQVTIQQTDIRG